MTEPKSTDSDANNKSSGPGNTGTKQPARVAAKKPEDNGGSRRPWVTWIILFLVVVAVALLTYWNWQQYQQHQQQQQQRESAQQSIEYLEQTTARLEQNSSETGGQLDSRLQSLQSEVRQQTQTLNEQARQIEHNARTLLEAGNRTRTDWLLAEAEYLLRVANQRLQIENDIDGALAALRATDDVVRSTDDVGALPIRKQVAKDILALESVAAVDRTGMYLQLEAAIDAVSNLTDEALADSASGGSGSGGDSQGGDENGGNGNGQSGGSGDSTAGSEVSKMLTEGWEKTKETLNNAISIRRMDEPVKPLLSPQQSVYARLNLRLMLEQAELAVLASNQVLYNRALTKAVDWLEQTYDDSHAPVSALINTLNELNGENINPELPDISESLELLKSRMEGRGGNGGDSGGDGNNGSNGDESAATPGNGAKAGYTS